MDMHIKKDYVQPFFLSLSLLLVVFSFLLINQLNAKLQAYIKTPMLSYDQDKSYTEQEVKVVNDEYEFKYVFKDDEDQLTHWSWSLNKEFVDNLNSNFGIASDFPDLSKLSSEEIASKKMELKSATMFMENEGKIVPNYYRIADVQNIITAPLYELAKEAAMERSGGRLEMIEILLKFCQDMPYKEIPDTYNNKLTKGLFPPSISLIEGYGDCDSKAMIFASALKNDKVFKMVVIYLPNHILIGIRGTPRPYQEAISFRGEKFIICEPSGPERYNFGHKPATRLGPIQMVRPL